MGTTRKKDLDILFDERYDDLKNVWRQYNDDGARFHSVDDMVEHLDHDQLLKDLDVTQDELDAVVLGEAEDLNTARELIEDGEGI